MRNPRSLLLEPIMTWLNEFGSPLGIPFTIWVVGVGSALLFMIGFFKAKKYLHVDDIPHGGRLMLIGVVGLFCAIAGLVVYLTNGRKW